MKVVNKDFHELEARVWLAVASYDHYQRMSQAYNDWLEAARVYRSLYNATPEQRREADERMEELWAKYLLLRG